jgi:hypothetical protein
MEANIRADKRGVYYRNAGWLPQARHRRHEPGPVHEPGM